MSKPSSNGKPGDGRRHRMLDVRPIIARGESPFAHVVATAAELGADDELRLVTPFLPSPLIEKLQGEGFTARPERRADGAWQTRFKRSS